METQMFCYQCQETAGNKGCMYVEKTTLLLIFKIYLFLLQSLYHMY